MPQTGIDRRTFLSTSAGLAFTDIHYSRTTEAAHRDELFVACRGDRDGTFSAVGLDEKGRERFKLPLPARGHSCAFRPMRDEVVVFARRPGDFALVIDTTTGELRKTFFSAERQHFYGHGGFTKDGRTLFTTCNHVETGEGRISIRDATDDYSEIDSYLSHGIGPHDVHLMPDGKTLAVANGGIRTHPSRGREKLNLETMQPALSYIDLADGALLDEHRLEADLHQASIRHLAVTSDGRVAIAMQYEGPTQREVSLLALHDGGDRLLHFDTPATIERRQHHYAASVAFDSSEQWIIVTHPRGNLVNCWRSDGTLHKSFDMIDCGGVSPTGEAGSFLLTNGLGQVFSFNVLSGNIDALTPSTGFSSFDNHAIWSGTSLPR